MPEGPTGRAPPGREVDHDGPPGGPGPNQGGVERLGRAHGRDLDGGRRGDLQREAAGGGGEASRFAEPGEGAGGGPERVQPSGEDARPDAEQAPTRSAPERPTNVRSWRILA